MTQRYLVRHGGQPVYFKRGAMKLGTGEDPRWYQLTAAQATRVRKLSERVGAAYSCSPVMLHGRTAKRSTVRRMVKRTAPRRVKGKKRTKTELRALMLRNLAKGRRVRAANLKRRKR